MILKYIEFILQKGIRAAEQANVSDKAKDNPSAIKHYEEAARWLLLATKCTRMK